MKQTYSLTELNQPLFSSEMVATLSHQNIPYHLAIIPDGNRRGAKKQALSIRDGYIAGANVFINTVRAAKELGIKVLTIFVFSTENWQRPQVEIAITMELLQEYIQEYQKKMVEMKIRFNTIGNLDNLPSSLKTAVRETSAITRECQEFDLVLAMNYGGRDEICRAARSLVTDCLEKKFDIKNLTEEKFSSYLDTAKWRDPDLLIRTSGEQRLSNFLMWQSSYTELFTEEVPWPEFTPQHLLNALLDYQRRERRRGGGAA